MQVSEHALQGPHGVKMQFSGHQGVTSREPSLFSSVTQSVVSRSAFSWEIHLYLFDFSHWRPPYAAGGLMHHLRLVLLALVTTVLPSAG